MFMCIGINKAKGCLPPRVGTGLQSTVTPFTALGPVHTELLVIALALDALLKIDILSIFCIAIAKSSV